MEQDKKTYYANSVQLKMQLYDLKLEFSTSHPDGTQESIINVFMSPQHAKVFSKILNEHIAIYQNTFGPIPDMPNQEKLVELKERGLINFEERALHE